MNQPGAHNRAGASETGRVKFRFRPGNHPGGLCLAVPGDILFGNRIRPVTPGIPNISENGSQLIILHESMGGHHRGNPFHRLTVDLDRAHQSMHRNRYQTGRISGDPITFGECGGHIGKTFAVRLVAGTATDGILLAALAVGTQKLLVLFEPVRLVILVGLDRPQGIARFTQ